MSEKSRCKHCRQLVEHNQIVVKEEKIKVNNQIRSYAWVGCKNCWEQLQKVS